MPEEIKQEVVLKTQKYLGKYVKKPPLSEKLLKKPPFRFLHDIVNTVIKETGFLKGLFSEAELNSENVKEKDAKVAFLSKLIDAVKVITNTDLAVRPSKIVAGLEPTETNLLLQTIGKAIEKKVDSSEYIKQLKSGEIISNDKNKKIKKSLDKNEKVKKVAKPPPNNEEKIRTTPKRNEKQISNETPKSTDRDKSKIKPKPKESKSKTGSEDVKAKSKEKPKRKEKIKEVAPNESNRSTQKENVQNTVATPDPVIKINEINEKNSNEISVSAALSNLLIPDEETIKTVTPDESKSLITINEAEPENETKKRITSASRPKSARPRSSDLKDKPNREENKEPIQIQTRPKSSLRPPSVRPSSARPGAPRLRPDSAFPMKEVVPMGKINVIVESFDKEDDEETVIIQNNPESVEEHVDNISDVPGDNKGHLVEQILEQISESDANKANSSVDNEWQKDIFYGKDTATKETNNLRSLIQSLTKTANPLGKLLNYLHEDIEAMHAELESWTNTKRQLFAEIAKQKKLSTEMNKPLVSQLEHLTQDITKMEEEIASTRSSILRNDIKIKELLSK